jgi:MarR family transcriptional regulator, temperature-dependent positive regulator of motility
MPQVSKEVALAATRIEHAAMSIQHRVVGETIYIDPADLQMAGKAHAMLRLRRQRDVALENATLFGEPAWDILLDLVIAHVDHVSVSVGSACVAASVPMTTALRYLDRLQQAGLIVEQRGHDRRRRYVRLSEAGLAFMRKLLL